MKFMRIPPLRLLIRRARALQLKWIIDNGICPSGMPASKGILNDDEIWQIVHFPRRLPPKGSLGEPPVYAGAQPALPATGVVGRDATP